MTKVAETYQLDKGVVSRWKNTIAADALQRVATEKENRIGNMIEAHLTTSLGAATGLASKVTDERWFSRQNAADIAVLYGVLTDKAIRILEAGEAASSAAEREREGSDRAGEG